MGDLPGIFLSNKIPLQKNRINLNQKMASHIQVLKIFPKDEQRWNNLLLNAVNLSLIAISGDLGDSSGHVMSLIIIAIAASEAALFMSLFVVLFRKKGSLDANIFDILGNKYES